MWGDKVDDEMLDFNDQMGLDDLMEEDGPDGVRGCDQHGGGRGKALLEAIPECRHLY